jgi:ribosomal protein S24E
MKFDIKKQVKTPFFSREEFHIEITADNNPTREEVIAFLKKDPEVCVVKEIQGNFGRNVFEAIVFVYDSVEAKEKTEYIPRKMKKKFEEEKKKAEEIKAKEEEKKKAEEEAKAKEAEEASKEEVKSEEPKEEVKDGN